MFTDSVAVLGESTAVDELKTQDTVYATSGSGNSMFGACAVDEDIVTPEDGDTDQEYVTSAASPVWAAV